MTRKGEVDQCGAQSRADSDHNPRKGVAKGFLPNKIAERPRYRLAARLYEVHDYRAISRPQDVRRDLDNPGEGCRIVNCPNAFAVPRIPAKVFGSSERARQWLELLL